MFWTKFSNYYLVRILGINKKKFRTQKNSVKSKLKNWWKTVNSIVSKCYNFRTVMTSKMQIICFHFLLCLIQF